MTSTDLHFLRWFIFTPRHAREHKYRFNPQTLNFERIRLSAWQKVKRVTLALTPGLLVGLVGIFLVYQFVDSPKEAALRREPAVAVAVRTAEQQLAEVDEVLRDVRRRDDNIYRVIFEADPLPEHAPCWHGGCEPLSRPGQFRQ